MFQDVPSVKIPKALLPDAFDGTRVVGLLVAMAEREEIEAVRGVF